MNMKLFLAFSSQQVQVTFTPRGKEKELGSLGLSQPGFIRIDGYTVVGRQGALVKDTFFPDAKGKNYHLAANLAFEGRQRLRSAA